MVMKKRRLTRKRGGKGNFRIRLSDISVSLSRAVKLLIKVPRRIIRVCICFLKLVKCNSLAKFKWLCCSDKPSMKPKSKPIGDIITIPFLVIQLYSKTNLHLNKY